MGKHVHVLSNIRSGLKVADCRGCGPDAAVVFKKHKGGWRCKVGDKGPGGSASPEAQLRARYRIDSSDFDRLMQGQGNACAICERPCSSGRRLAVDHDHDCCPGRASCGRCVRGLLCMRCNAALGGFRDSPELLLRAVAYLTTNNTN